MEGTPTGWKTRRGSLGPGTVKGRRPNKETKCNQTFSKWNTHDLVKLQETTAIPLSRASWIAFMRSFCFFWHTPEIKSVLKVWKLQWWGLSRNLTNLRVSERIITFNSYFDTRQKQTTGVVRKFSLSFSYQHWTSTLAIPIYQVKRI